MCPCTCGWKKEECSDFSNNYESYHLILDQKYSMSYSFSEVICCKKSKAILINFYTAMLKTFIYLSLEWIISQGIIV